MSIRLQTGNLIHVKDYGVGTWKLDDVLPPCRVIEQFNLGITDAS